jgi:hypothetical protein
MKHFLFSTTFLFLATASFGQLNEKELLVKSTRVTEKVTDTTNSGWKRPGNVVFLFNQSAFNNNWLAGGTTNMAGNIVLNYDFNYNTKNLVWDNKIVAAYGLTKVKDQPLTKTDDRLEITSLYGKKTVSGYWFYSAFLNFRTQFDSGFDPKTGAKLSHFFSPAFLQLGSGMLWKKTENLKVNIAPATSRIIFVNKFFTQNLAFGESYYGVTANKSIRYEFGAAVNAYYKLILMENITMENILNLYSNYTDKPLNIVSDYQMNMIMKINKLISANLNFQTIYDENAIAKVQVRQVFGLGLNYKF